MRERKWVTKRRRLSQIVMASSSTDKTVVKRLFSMLGCSSWVVQGGREPETSQYDLLLDGPSRSVEHGFLHAHLS